MRLFYIIIILTIYTASHAKVDERRIALVIGNAEYSTMGKLTNPANDANDMVKALNKLGFDVISGTNLSKKMMADKIREFDTKLQSGDKSNTIGLFYYAGHGMEVAGKNYLVPVDADLDYQEDIRDDGVALNRVVSRMNYSKNRANIVILDSCRDNPLPKRDRSSAGVGWGAINEVVSGMFIAYGTAPGRKSADDSGNGRNGLFTKHILQNINTPGKSISQIFNTTRVGVLQDSNGNQTTWQNSAMTGDFYFTPLKINPMVTNHSVTTSNSQLSPVINTNSRKPGDTFQDCSDCPEMVVIPAGNIQIGSGYGAKSKFSIYKVNIKQFSMSQTEVTFAQWDSCYASGGCTHKPKDAGWGRGNRPVININWSDAKEYIQWLSNKTGKNYRLPSESEWEFAAQANNSKINCKLSGCGGNDNTTSEVKSFIKNDFGLYGMYSNVSELIEDCYHSDYSEPPSNGSAWQTNCSKTNRRILRGYSHNLPSVLFGPTARTWSLTTSRSKNSGIRLAQSL